MNEAKPNAAIANESCPDYVFPPMPDEVFAAKLAKWNARGPKPPRSRSGFGRVASKPIPREQFDRRIAAVSAGRRKHEAENMMGDRRDGVIT